MDKLMLNQLSHFGPKKYTHFPIVFPIS
jgi:hypothetical protein